MSTALKLNRYRDALLALRANLDAHLSRLPDNVSDVADSGDRANHHAEGTVTMCLATHEAVIRKEIDDALERINAGTFAICESCQFVIGTRRLDAIPYTRYCVRCERRVEQEGTV